MAIDPFLIARICVIGILVVIVAAVTVFPAGEE